MVFLYVPVIQIINGLLYKRLVVVLLKPVASKNFNYSDYGGRGGGRCWLV